MAGGSVDVGGSASFGVATYRTGGTKGGTKGGAGGSATAVAVEAAGSSDPSTSVVGFALLFALARAVFTSTFSAFSTDEDALVAESLNQSLIVAASPKETADIWFVISGISSAVHFAMMSFEETPSSFAILCTLRVVVFFATCGSFGAASARRGFRVIRRLVFYNI